MGHHKGRVVTTHDSILVNLQDSYTQHRCYHYMGKCVCECLDAPDFNTGDEDRHQDQPNRGRIEEQEIFEAEHSRFSGLDDSGSLKIREDYKPNNINRDYWQGAPTSKKRN
jgi:hypothetical protein